METIVWLEYLGATEAIARQVKSVEPPAAKELVRVTGREGYFSPSSASSFTGIKKRRKKTKAHAFWNLFMFCSSSHRIRSKHA